MTLTIDPEFRSLIPPLTREERDALELNLLTNGCNDALVTWNGTLLDGHNRYEICTAEKIKFTTREVACVDRDAAKIWIIRNQFGRRNLTTMQRTQLVIKLEPLLSAQAEVRMKSGKANPVQNSAQGKTRDELAKLAGVSHDTIDKVKKIEASPVKELSRMTREGAVSINAASRVATMPEPEQRKIVEAGPEAVKEAAKTTTAPAEDPAPKPRGKAIEIAHNAIAVLLTIPPKDALRKEALALVVRWCKHNP